MYAIGSIIRRKYLVILSRLHQIAGCFLKGVFMREIQLTQGKVALVDDEDFEELNKHKWYAHMGRNTFYARTRVKEKQFLMHRLICCVDKIIQIDHIDGNGLNNQKANLRQCNNTQNHQNMKRPSRNTSGYKGVSYNSVAKKYEAYINTNGKKHFIGLFNNPLSAAAAYNAASLKYHGSFSKRNEV